MLKSDILQEDQHGPWNSVGSSGYRERDAGAVVAMEGVASADLWSPSGTMRHEGTVR